ncbi:MAG: U32 family peptidase [Lentisphaeria bacterium]|nr:U32 family peptidase [Lentisphaeria bacterium]
MKYQVGYQDNRQFINYLLRHIQDVSEVYFPWGNFTTGRGVILSDNTCNNLAADLRCFSAAGVKLCLLLNGNCYGHRALSRNFFQQLGDTVDHLKEEYSVSGVTTASPLIARFLRRNFPDLEIRASVNMEIGTPEGIEYVEDYFDSFYLKREYNYDLEKIVQMRDFCRKRGKKLYILANSGCLNFCSARTFHDNLVAHQHEISEMDNAFEFHGECTTFLKKGDNRLNLLSKTNFIRPEDVSKYEDLCDGMKLATRTNFNPLAVVSAYFSGKWNGNLLDLTEPAHSEILLPEILSNRSIPSDYAEKRLHCKRNCNNCGYCRKVQENATVVLDKNFTDL